MAKAWTCIYRDDPAVRWTEADGKEHIKRCTDPGTARKLCQLINRELDLSGFYPARTPEALPGPAPIPGLLTVAEAWLTDKRRTLAPRTVAAYAGYLDQLDAFLAADDPARVWTVADFSRSLLARGFAYLCLPSSGRHGRARDPQTAAKAVEVWALLWTWAADSDDYAAHTPPPRRIDLPSRPRPSPLAPTWGQVRAMYDALVIEAPYWTSRLIELAWYLGERREALLRLEWSAVDLARRRLTIPDAITKGGTGGRTIPIHEDLAARLRSWGPGQGSILQPPALELSGRGHIDRTVRRAWQRAGVPRETWTGQPIHGLRATLRTHLAAVGVSGDLIDSYIGHQRAGTGGRHYTDAAALVGPLRAVVAQIPTLDSVIPDPTGQAEDPGFAGRAEERSADIE